MIPPSHGTIPTTQANIPVQSTIHGSVDSSIKARMSPAPRSGDEVPIRRFEHIAKEKRKVIEHKKGNAKTTFGIHKGELSNPPPFSTEVPTLCSSAPSDLSDTSLLKSTSLLLCCKRKDSIAEKASKIIDRS
mmetsp:Transcript_15797/g.29909  ORF Transcript_15797/g.29909 Transcript_15797/m.29909 type:complete len:132 (-) Transcript_15797:428-823(-)